MPTLWNETDRTKILERISALTPDRKPLWGGMDAARMLAHATGPIRMLLGECPAAPKRGPFRYFPIKQLIVYWAPWPKGAPTAPEFVHHSADWARSLAEINDAITRFARIPSDAALPLHPAFGRLSRKAWGVLMWRHLDHHLRQFSL